MINRDNYEAFFLMYVDGELSTAEKEMVEAFVQLHADLQEELAMLQQTVLLPENDIIFANKNLLFKHTESNNNNNTIYEEKLLLYIDNELATQEKAALETALLSNVTLQNDLALLQQTKLPLENIACPNKAALYKEEKKRRIVYMRWQYMAAAAIVFGLVATVYFIAPSGKTTHVSLAIVDRTKKQSSPVILSSTVTTQAEKPVTIAPKLDVPATTLESNNTIQVAKKLPVTQAVDATQQPLVTTNIPKPFKDGAQDFLANPSKTIENNIASAVTNPATNRTNNSLAKNDPTDASSPAVTNALNTTNIAAQQVVYKEIDTNSDDKSLLVGAIEINKDKLRGFLRKASKLFGNKQKNDDDAKSSLVSNK
ncbi:hypothetical protein ACFOW1_14335 [Parasediminibacterium paludis]|uniref:Zinc finger protein n=1 Tax=Parasediminibacterium paludis TaxID=908966 RepID=A0ABV8Q036_9BACT